MQCTAAVPSSRRPTWKGPATGSVGRRLATVTAFAAALTLALPPAPLSAQNRIPLIRDAETEALIQDYIAPIFKAAGVKSTSVEIHIVPNSAFNAFVADGANMFVYTGALLETETPNELVGVLAHETGHIVGNHLGRLRTVVRNTQIAAIVAGILGMGAALAAASATGDSSLGSAGGGIAMGAGEMARRNILSYMRSEELAADRAAISYLEAAGQSPTGMMRTFARFADQNLFFTRATDPYLLSHPVPRERMAQIEQLVAQSPYRDRTDPPALQLRHDLMRAKIAAFSQDPARVARAYPNGDNSLPARYAQAIVTLRFGDLDRGLRMIDGLIQSQPSNPYFWELKGQFMLEGGRAAQSLEPLRKSVSLDPDSGLLRILLGHALVETGNDALLDEAVKNLTIGLQLDPSMPNGYRQLARAYAKRGDIGQAQLATAQGLFAEGEIEDAKIQAKRAQAKLKSGTPAWLRADDIIAYEPPKL
jgi:predicted Zn-dependent protease